MFVMDSHVHCGLTQSFEKVRSLWSKSGIDGGVLFPPVEEVYDRYDPNFYDSDFYKKSRAEVHNYLKSLNSNKIFIFWFVWNDFQFPDYDFVGVKWHRHSDEPKYNYESEKFEDFIEHICSRKLPVVLEEELQNTLKVIELINKRTVVIIPHMGMLNGGYAALKEAGVFENPLVYTDTALAGTREMADFAANYGVERILFGSDFPFGRPNYERKRAEQVFSGRDRKKVLGENLLELL